MSAACSGLAVISGSYARAALPAWLEGRRYPNPYNATRLRPSLVGGLFHAITEVFPGSQLQISQSFFYIEGGPVYGPTKDSAHVQNQGLR